MDTCDYGLYVQGNLGSDAFPDSPSDGDFVEHGGVVSMYTEEADWVILEEYRHLTIDGQKEELRKKVELMRAPKKKTYNVDVWRRELWCATVTVEADNEDEARELAQEASYHADYDFADTEDSGVEDPVEVEE